jgi:hypothetical protein
LSEGPYAALVSRRLAIFQLNPVGERHRPAVELLLPGRSTDT